MKNLLIIFLVTTSLLIIGCNKETDPIVEHAVSAGTQELQRLELEAQHNTYLRAKELFIDGLESKEIYKQMIYESYLPTNIELAIEKLNIEYKLD